jgi:thiol-disulfide isomerase/thioredoxin
MEVRTLKQINNEQQYEEQIAKEQLTVLKFFTTWCPDCKNLNQFITPIMDEHSDKDWYEIDAEALQDIAEKNEVKGIPSLLVFKNGQKIGHLHSKFAKTPDQIKTFLEEFNETL